MRRGRGLFDGGIVVVFNRHQGTHRVRDFFSGHLGQLDDAAFFAFRCTENIGELDYVLIGGRIGRLSQFDQRFCPLVFPAGQLV